MLADFFRILLEAEKKAETGREFEVRKSRNSELRTSNSELRVTPVAHTVHVSLRHATASTYARKEEMARKTRPDIRSLGLEAAKISGFGFGTLVIARYFQPLD